MDFTVICKPTHICNLRCRYCVNEDERRPIMSEETLGAMTNRMYEYVNKPGSTMTGVSWVWHGGEPTVVGLPFFEKAVALQERYRGQAGASNFFQTNGLLLNERWFDFFKANKFSLSLSIDGPRHVHDEMRVDALGRGSFDKTMAVIEMAQSFGLTPGVVVTINRANVGYASEIYEMLAARGIAFNVIPIVKSGDAVAEYENLGIEPEEWTDVFIDMYDKWFDSNPSYIYVDDFIHATRAVITGSPVACTQGSRNCSSWNISVDPKGDVFPCGWLSGHDELRYGNLNRSSLESLLNTQPAHGLRSRVDPPECGDCEWKYICHGGCMAHSYLFNGSVHKKTYYCHTVKNGYSHIAKRLSEKGIRPGMPVIEDPLNYLRPAAISEARRVIPIQISH